MKTTLTLNDSLQNSEAKTKITEITSERHYDRKGRIHKGGKPFMMIWIKHNDPEKDSVLAQYASRHLDSTDDRFAEYRKQFSAILKHFQANGLLDFEPTQEQLENPKGFRWCQKAYCKCGCSPAFSMPSWFKTKGSHNEIRVSLEVKPELALDINYSEARLNAVKDSVPVLRDEAERNANYEI